MDWKNKNQDYFKKESEMFNLAADYYDKYRPSYPKEIMDILFKETKINNKSRLLEIGAGSGKATELFSHLNCDILCVEPGIDLVKNGKIKFANNSNIFFECNRFENMDIKANYYDLIYAFQAFHWIPQPFGFQKCYEGLNDKGKIALVWNMYITYDHEMDKELLKISSKYGNFADFLSEEDCEKRILYNKNNIENSGLFNNVKIFRHLWQISYTPDDYFGFCLTGNSFVQKSDKIKEEAYFDLCNYAMKFGGKIDRKYLCVLYLADKLS